MFSSHVSQLPPWGESHVLRQQPGRLCCSGVPTEWAPGRGRLPLCPQPVPTIPADLALPAKCRGVGCPLLRQALKPRGLAPGRSGACTRECRCTGPHTRGSLLSEGTREQRCGLSVDGGHAGRGSAQGGVGGRGLPAPHVAAAPGGSRSRRGNPVRTPRRLCPEAAALSCGSSSRSAFPRISKSR